MSFFVQENCIIRKIWGKSDTILFIFAGSAAEFALNRAVDWLYFTGRLPADPLGRLFSTVEYSRLILLSEKQEANKAIDKISAIHASVEKARGVSIPDWAYRDVLFMLIHYSIASYELLERTLTMEEKEKVFNVFYRIGERMKLKELPPTYRQWLSARREHLQNDLVKSKYTNDLFSQYEKHLGAIRFKLLKEAQILVVPKQVKKLLSLGEFSWISLAVPLYKLSRLLKLDALVKSVLLPYDYKEQIRALDVVP